jgi:hypothetical protein
MAERPAATLIDYAGHGKIPVPTRLVSYAFLHADKIKDFNVPLVGGENMWQALATLGVPTQLVVYPNSFHGITRPSYQKDRMERYLAWYAKYLK